MKLKWILSACVFLLLVGLVLMVVKQKVKADQFEGGYEYSIESDGHYEELINTTKKKFGEPFFGEFAESVLSNDVSESTELKIISEFDEGHYIRLVDAVRLVYKEDGGKIGYK